MPESRSSDTPFIGKLAVENFRCFRGAQSARLAPLTVLGGDNSTGKTSFLAIIRALWDVACGATLPDFKEPPFDLGTFRETVNSHASDGNATEFRASFEIQRDRSPGATGAPTASVVFRNRDEFPWPEVRRYERGDVSFEIAGGPREPVTARSRVDGHDWEVSEPGFPGFPGLPDPKLLWRVASFRRYSEASRRTSEERALAVAESPEPDYARIEDLLDAFVAPPGFRPHASAPIRTYPRRTYDPIPPRQDPEGLDAPNFLNHVSLSEPEAWKTLRTRLNDFGRKSGLFSEIKVRHLGRTPGSPFQILVRPQSSGGRRPPFRNLADVGYGVSQILPILTSTLRSEPPPVLLLQQPEIHLHPRAQAELGTLLCEVASSRQVILETHSDFILDRIRMDIRDRVTDLRHHAISVIHFERKGSDARAYSLAIDEHGDLDDVPIGFGDFFLQESGRFIGLEDVRYS